jgi:hypothetical protein
MAVINKTGITNGTTIQAEHVTRAIDALSGGSTDSVVATGSFNGTLTGNATTATTATNATNVAVTNTSTGTGPYYITFVESATGNVGQRVDATGLTYNATTDTITATASFAVSSSGAISSSFATTASFALNVANVQVTNNTTGTGPYSIPFVDVSAFNPAIAFTTPRSQLVDASGLTYNATTNTITATSSYAVTASYALNAGGGTGVGFPFTGSAQVTGSMGITGSLNVTGGVTASLFGTASVAIRTRDEFITLNFTHGAITNTTSGTVRYFGGFSLPTNSTVGRIGLAAPFDCTIVSSSITIYNSSFNGSGQVDYSLYAKGQLMAPLSSTIDLDDYIKDEAFAVQGGGGAAVVVLSGDLLTIELRELADSTGGYQTHVALLLKKL